MPLITPDHHHVSIEREPHTDEVLARGGDARAAGILQRSAFVAVARAHDSYHRLPLALSKDEQVLHAARAAGLLTSHGYTVTTDPEFAPSRQTFAYVTLGQQVAAVAEQIDRATHTQEVAEALTELTATHDGVLDSARACLTVAAAWIEELGDAADPARADRLRQLAEYLDHVRWDLAGMRNDLAERHIVHPRRTVCPGIDNNEREASVTCSCPPTLPRPPAPPAAGPPRRTR
ncbi:hypothetical protein ACFY0R_10155 [Streptomyces sp. NPDC001633]|uniref:hypothetical protein n=1 Tax=Streptomyces sp. NPDC001633 TaxID=3364595 RepID=UPI00369EE3E7